MTTLIPPSVALPVTSEQLARLHHAVHDFTPHQLAWLAGYFLGLSQPAVGNTPAVATPARASAVTVLSASQTGNARRLAEQLRDDVQAAGVNVTLVNAGDYKYKQIVQEQILLLVISTQGEGDPPEEAISLQKYLFSKKAPKLGNTAFAVFALGDSSYEYFCQAGKVFDQRLTELGGHRLFTRVDADIEYQDLAIQWRQQMVTLLKDRLPAAVQGEKTSSLPVVASLYSKEQPFSAELLVSHKLTGRRSEKDVRHLEIDLTGSGLTYRPGDSLGVWYENDPELIAELLPYLGLSGEEQVAVDGMPFALAEALQYRYELTQNTAGIVKQYAELTQNVQLCALLADKSALQHYAHHTPIVDMVRIAPTVLNGQRLLEFLRPLTPRLYSIASSQQEVGNEVHITVGVVRYQIDGHQRSGGASAYLADRLRIEQQVRVFIERNDHFRLPADPDAAIIMIGPGTGIAPFRAFMQEREVTAAQGKNWLLFGNPHFTEDFLYQVEWQRFVKSGVLTRLDLAWSRDQADKIYVQDKIRLQAREIWQWLQQGAYLYVCGDANRMAKDVELALLAVIAEQGGMDLEQADEYLSELRLAKRYQRDIY